MFFGVPNKGLNNTHLIPMVQGQPNAHLVVDLCEGSQYLSILHESFCQNFTTYDSRIVSIYETLDTPSPQVNTLRDTLLAVKSTKAFRKHPAPMIGAKMAQVSAW